MFETCHFEFPSCGEALASANGARFDGFGGGEIAPSSPAKASLMRFPPLAT